MKPYLDIHWDPGKPGVEPLQLQQEGLGHFTDGNGLATASLDVDFLHKEEGIN